MANFATSQNKEKNILQTDFICSFPVNVKITETENKIASERNILSVIVLMMFFGVEDRPVFNNNYCEMVSIYIESEGENGWPDYNGNYSEICQ